LTLVILVAAAAPAQARSTLAEQWLLVQQGLVSENREEVEGRILEFQQTADDLAVRRMTPYAAALVLWAKDHPGALAETVVRRAQVLDPELPSSYFLLARWQWERREWIEGARTYIAGWWAVFLYEPSRHALIASLGSWLLLVIGWTLGVAILLQVLRYIRQIAHDAVETAGLLFRRPNAIVLAVVILFLPVFAGLGPIWLGVYVFSLSWAYMGVGQRVAAVLTCCVLALLVPALSGWQRAVVRSPSVEERLAIMLGERGIDPSTLREFAGFEREFEGIAAYHLILGELVRMHGDAEGARIQFQKSALNDDIDPAPLIFLGNLAMEEGDIARAIQRYNAAIDLEPRSGLAYHNLSSAYDQSRRFEDGSEAHDTARSLMEGRPETVGIRGRDDRIRYPRLGTVEIRRVVNEAPPDIPLVAAGPAFGASLPGQLLEPTSRVFWTLALLGLLIMLLRRRWMWTAQICTKCGKVFCPRCKTATESASYCSQCISVFLKRDMVSIEQQSAKAEQIRRWMLWSSIGRRVAGVVVPGSSHLLNEGVGLGLLISFFAWLFLSGAVIWAPLTLPSVDPLLAIAPIQIILGVGFLILWLRSIAVAWYRR
jgi:tetratricopeptide (TPR) repeat protein